MKICISKNIKLLLLTLFFLLSLNISCLAEEPALENPTTEKIVYLTFDDGPSGKVTNKVLDILKKEDVPATFFVIGSQLQDQEDIILRMKNEGHSIGLHSTSHNRNKLYNSNDSFLKEMLNEQAALEKITGEKHNILRFPFGCNNSTYKLTNSLVNLLHENNLKIFDWTQDSGDGANYNASPDLIYRKSISANDTVVVLMHCSYINKNSTNALPSIINYYKKSGYKFKVIDETTPEIYKITRPNN